jgi:hypothetical protein
MGYQDLRIQLDLGMSGKHQDVILAGFLDCPESFGAWISGFSQDL